jgi:hypothetical protein
VSSEEVERRLYILCTIINVSTVKVSSIMSRWVVDVLMSDASKVAASVCWLYFLEISYLIL